MTKFIQELVNGLTQGGLYALVALGYSMVYGVLKLLNFAHGDLYMVGAFVGYFVLQWFGGPTALARAGADRDPGHVPRSPAAGSAHSGWRSSASPTGRSETRRASRR